MKKLQPKYKVGDRFRIMYGDSIRQFEITRIYLGSSVTGATVWYEGKVKTGRFTSKPYALEEWLLTEKQMYDI